MQTFFVDATVFSAVSYEYHYSTKKFLESSTVELIRTFLSRLRLAKRQVRVAASTLHRKMLRSSKKWLLILLVLGLSEDCQGWKPVMSPAKPEIYIDEGDSLELTCTSAKTMGFSYPKDVINEIKTSTASLNEQSLSDVQKIIFRRPETVHGDTGWYGCAAHDFDITPGIYDSPEVRWTYVYVKSNASYFVQFNVLQAFPEVIHEMTNLPCRPTSPHYKVILNADDEEIQMGGNASYDPRFGFQLRNFTFKDRGYFRCLIQEGNTIQEIDFLLPSIWNHTLSAWTPINPSVTRVMRGRTSYVSCTTDVKADIPYVFNWTTPQQSDRIATRLFKETIALNREKIISVLRINRVTDEDEGEYECTLTTNSTVKKYKMYILVYDPDRNDIKLKPLHGDRNFTRGYDENVELAVLVNAHPLTQLRWLGPLYEDGETITSARKLPKYDVESKLFFTMLTIDYLQDEDFGVYSLEATNKGRIEILNFTLELIGKPLAKIFPYLNVNFVNERTDVMCNVWARPAPNVTWIFTKAPSVPKDYPSFKKSEIIEFKNYEYGPNLRRVYYSLVTMMIEAPGKLTCMACNIVGCHSATSQVDISNVPTAFGIIEMETELVEGDDFEIICIASTEFYSAVTWSENMWTEVAETDRISITRNRSGNTYCSTLRIENLQKSDNNSLYICEAQRSINYGRTPYTLLIHDSMAPVISETNMNKTTIALDLSTEKHKIVILTCHVQGMPKPNVTWYKDDERISANEQYECHYNNQELHIKSLLHKNSGRYTCKVENRFGKAENYQMILVKANEAYKVWIIPIVVLVVICAILVVYLYYRRKVMRKQLMEAGLTYFEEGALQRLNPNLTVDDQAGLLPYDKKWEFPRDRLKFGKQLGFGAFGVVTKADALGICTDEAVSTVAVKMARKSTASTYVRALASELKIMVHLGKHLNIVNLLGACTKNIIKHELLVIVEYCRFGNLHDYLLRRRADFINQIDPSTHKVDPSIGHDLLTKATNVESRNSLSANSSNSNPRAELVSYTTGKDSQGISRSPDDGVVTNNLTQAGCQMNYRGDYEDQNLQPICTQNLLSWAFQVARGMEYLSQRKVLHGDLAARNILLADNNIVKICDFGLARNMYKDENYKKQGGVPLPIKWMAIESISDRIFSTQSDIWSFGIVLWEFFTLAKTPYPSMGPERQYQRLIEGYRMEQPEYATDEIYEIMMQCWKEKPTLRPTFTYLVSSIGDLLQESVKEYYMDMNIPYMDMNATVFENGENDYLTMMSAPDHDTLVSSNNNHVNSRSLPAVVPRNDSYMPMKPPIHGGDLGILSPRTTLNCNKINFPTSNRKSNVLSGSTESIAVELSPMLNHDDDNNLKLRNVQEQPPKCA